MFGAGERAQETKNWQMALCFLMSIYTSFTPRHFHMHIYIYISHTCEHKKGENKLFLGSGVKKNLPAEFDFSFSISESWW